METRDRISAFPFAFLALLHYLTAHAEKGQGVGGTSPFPWVTKRCWGKHCSSALPLFGFWPWVALPWSLFRTWGWGRTWGTRSVPWAWSLCRGPWTAPPAAPRIFLGRSGTNPEVTNVNPVLQSDAPSRSVALRYRSQRCLKIAQNNDVLPSGQCLCFVQSNIWIKRILFSYFCSAPASKCSPPGLQGGWVPLQTHWTSEVKYFRG